MGRRVSFEERRANAKKWQEAIVNGEPVCRRRDDLTFEPLGMCDIECKEILPAWRFWKRPHRTVFRVPYLRYQKWDQFAGERACLVSWCGPRIESARASIDTFETRTGSVAEVSLYTPRQRPTP